MIKVIDIKDIPNRGTKSKIIKDIEDFVSSGAGACEVFSDYQKGC